MAVMERLALIIDADGKGAVRELDKVGRAAERELGRAESRADRMATSFQSAGTKMMATSAIIGAGLWAAGQSAADLEQAVGGTESVFKDSAGVIDEWAKTADQTAGLSEEAARRLTTGLGGALQGLGFETEDAAQKSVELTKVAADLAATYGGTTEEAVTALGAAFRGEADPAERFNLFLKQGDVNAKAVAMGLAESTSSVDRHAKAQATLALIMEQSADAQGQFAREADTASGQMARSRAAAENAKAALGDGFLPVMTALTEALGKGAEGFSALNDATGGVAAQVVGYGTAFLGVAGAVSWTTGKVIEMRDTFKSLPATGSKIGKFIGNNAAGLGVLGGALGAATIAWQVHTQSQARAQARIDAVRDSLDQQTGALTENTDELLRSEFATNNQMDDLERAGLTFDDVTSAIEDQSGELLALNDLTERMKGDRGNLVTLLNEEGGSRNRLIATLVEEGEANQGLVQSLYAQFDAYDQAKEQIDASTSIGATAEEQTNDLAAATNDSADAADSAAEAQEELAGKIEDTKDEIEKAIDAIDEFYDALDAPGDLVAQWESSMDGLQEALTENGTAWNYVTGQLDLGTEAGRQNREALLEVRDAAIDAGQAVRESGGSAEDAANKTLGLVENLKHLMRQSGYSEEAIAAMIAEMGLTPDVVRTQFEQPGLDDAFQRVAHLQMQLDALPAVKRIGIQVSGGFGNISSFAQGVWGRDEPRAAGGPVRAGGTYLVGERGPELVTMGAGGTVHNASETQRMMGGGGQPVVINIAGHKVAEVLLPAISDGLAKDRRAHTGSRRVG